jgi:hypothetical protein
MPRSRSHWQQGHHNANQGEGRPLSAKWKMHRSHYERSSEFLHVRHRSVVLRGVRYRRQAGCRQCSPWDEQARVSKVSTVGDGPHQFRTRNDHSTVQRTQSNSNKNAEKTTELIDFRSLITVWFLVRVQAGPPAFAREARKAAAPMSRRQGRAVGASYGSANHPASRAALHGIAFSPGPQWQFRSWFRPGRSDFEWSRPSVRPGFERFHFQALKSL